MLKGSHLRKKDLSSKVAVSYFNWQLMGLFILWLISLGLVGFTIDKSLLKIGICLSIFITFSGWGHVVVYPIHYKEGKAVDGFIWGSVSGIALASLITSVIVYVIGWNLPIIFGSVIGLPALVLFALKRKGGTYNKLPTGRHVDFRILLGALIVVTLFFYFPFKNLGALVGDKYLYSWLFGHDFIIRMVHVNSLSSGLPLDSFFFAGEKLSYYWLAYVYPALIRNVDWIKLDLKQILQITQLLYSLLTVGALVIFLKHFVHQKRVLIMLIFLALCCYSYVGLYNIGVKGWSLLAGENYVELFGYKSTEFSGFSHGFYRFFLVEPQATLGMGLILMILLLHENRQGIYVFGIIGLLLGLLFGVEATNGIMLILWFVSTGLFMFFVNRRERYSIAKKRVSALVCSGLVCLLLFAIQMYSLRTGRGVLKLALNWFPVITGPLYFILAYGPVFLIGIAGLLWLFKQKESLDHWAYPYVLLFGVSILFVFFITNPTELHFGLLKATRIIPICLLVFTAYFFESIIQTQKLKRIIIVLILLGLPSLFTDNFVASNISNASTYLRCSDMEAANWIKKNLPRKAIIQAEPNYPGIQNKKSPKYSYSFVPIFAERPTAIGEWKVSSQEHSKSDEVRERFHAIKRMFSITDLDGGIEIIKRYNIGYIYIGELERELYPNGMAKFANNEHFQLIYSKGDVSIYKFISQ